MGAEASHIRQQLHSPETPVVAIDRRFCRDTVTSVHIRQDALFHPGRGVVKELCLDNNSSPLLFRLTDQDAKSPNARVLLDADGVPIVYLHERNRAVMRGFMVSHDVDGYNELCSIKRKHLTADPVRVRFKELSSGRLCEMGASVLQTPHVLTALLWLDVGDGSNTQLPVGRFYFPTDYNKDRDEVRFVSTPHAGYEDGYDEDYRLDIMPNVDIALAVLVAAVTATLKDPKRRNGG